MGLGLGAGAREQCLRECLNTHVLNRVCMIND